MPRNIRTYNKLIKPNQEQLVDAVNEIIESVNTVSAAAERENYKGKPGDIKVNKVNNNKYDFYVRGEDGWHRDTNSSYAPVNDSQTQDDVQPVILSNGTIDNQYQGSSRILLNLDEDTGPTGVANPKIEFTGNGTISTTGEAKIDSVGDIELNADGGDINFKDGALSLGSISSSGLSINNINSNTGTSVSVTLGTDIGDDFIVDTTSLVVEGDNNRVGIGIAAPTTTLDVEGTVSYKHTAFSTTGPTDSIDVSGTTVLEVDTSSNNVTIGGFAGGVQGQILYIVKTDTTNFINLEHNESPSVGDQQKIFLTSGANERVVGYGGYTLYCNGDDWFSLSNPTGAADSG
mgnify:CR=1 FL=1